MISYNFRAVNGQWSKNFIAFIAITWYNGNLNRFCSLREDCGFLTMNKRGEILITNWVSSRPTPVLVIVGTMKQALKVKKQNKSFWHSMLLRAYACWMATMHIFSNLDRQAKADKQCCHESNLENDSVQFMLNVSAKSVLSESCNNLFFSSETHSQANFSPTSV